MDWNVADREKRLNSPIATDDDCYRMGQTHKAYGWAYSPSGDWNDIEQDVPGIGWVVASEVETVVICRNRQLSDLLQESYNRDG